MARLRPFRAWRPRPELAAQVASPPYDVLSSDEARRMADGNPLSFLHVGKPEIDLPPGTDVYSTAVYEKGAVNLRRLIEKGVLVREPAPALYLYRQRMGDHVQTGLVGGASVDEYESGLIKKHEHTRMVKEDDRTRHIDALEAQTGPVFLTYKARPEIDAIVSHLSTAPPTYDFVAPDGIQHVMWVIGDPAERDRLIAAFAPVPEMYVADGHHRSAAATRVRAQRRQANPGHTGEEGYNFFLAVIFPHDQMQILDYNRVLKDLNGREPEAFLAQLRTSFELTPVASGRPGRQRCFGMYLAGKWYRLTAKAGTYPTDDPVQSLDVAILQDNLLGPVFGIGDPRKDERIDFVGGIRGLGELERLVDSGRFAVAFAVHPTSIEQLFAVADAGRVMPPKSTWFEPKLRDGLIIRPLEDC
jgi:uncharacterized protein (DUF1015 family)